MSTDAPNTDASADTGHDAAASAATTPAATTPAATTHAAATPKPTPPPSPSIPPPSPSFTVPTYSLPEPATQDWLTRTRTWIEDHPALAVTAAVGVGLTLGRVLSGAFKAPPPPSLTERVEVRARELGDEIAKRGTTAAEKGRVMAAKGSAAASDAGDVLRERLQDAGEKFGDVAEVAAERAEEGYEKAKDFADVVADAVKAAVLGVVAKKADDWFDKLKK
ncbi:MAG: hypothetical protein AAFP15_15960 [Bacteroidota bacterium]